MPTPRVLVLFNEPTLPADHPDADSEHDILYTADTVARILTDAGLKVVRHGAGTDPGAIAAGVRAANPDAVFNLYEGTAAWGNSEAFVAGMLELLRVPFTGSPTKPLMLCRSKPLTKQLLAGAGLPTAPFIVVEDGPVPPCPLPWPVIVKPGLEDASIGIDQGSVVTSQAELEARVEYIRGKYGPHVLVERFVRGREFNVAVVERDGRPATLPFSEILFEPPAESPDLWPIVSFDAKWRPGTRDFVATPAKNPAENVSPELHAAVAGLALRAFELVGCRDYARVDFRVDEAGNPFVLEVNPNPCISPLAGLAAGLETAKVPYGEFILGLVRAALARGGQVASPQVASRQPVGSDVGLEDLRLEARKKWKVRPARRADLGFLEHTLMRLDGLPRAERTRLTLRTLDAVGRRGRGAVLVASGEDGPAGAAWVRPLDDGTAVLEVLAVAPDARRAGAGAALLAVAEQAAATSGDRVLLVHLSSSAGGAAGRQFLARHGFAPAGEIADFYPDEYARLTYAKRLSVPAAAHPAAESQPAAG